MSNQEIRQVLETKVYFMLLKNLKKKFDNDMKWHIFASSSAKSDILADNHSLHPLVPFSAGDGNRSLHQVAIRERGITIPEEEETM